MAAGRVLSGRGSHPEALTWTWVRGEPLKAMVMLKTASPATASGARTDGEPQMLDSGIHHV